VLVASDAVTGVPLDYADLVLKNSVSLVVSVHTMDDITLALGTLTR
jgi:hypothetical protein